MIRFGALRAAMLTAGYRQNELAVAIGIEKSSFSRKMTAKSSFRLDEAYKIMDILKLPYNDLVKYFPKDGVA